MGVLYVKQAFENLCKDVRVRMSELLEHPEEFREDMEMWSLLHSNDIVAVETELLDSIDALISQAVPTKQLGERDPAQERKTLYTSIVTVVKEMTGLRCELFLRGPKPIQSVSKFRRASWCIRRLRPACWRWRWQRTASTCAILTAAAPTAISVSSCEATAIFSLCRSACPRPIPASTRIPETGGGRRA